MDEIRRIVDNGIDDMFSAAVAKYKLEYGDVTPEDVIELDNVKDVLYNVMTRFVNENQV